MLIEMLYLRFQREKTAKDKFKLSFLITEGILKTFNA